VSIAGDWVERTLKAEFPDLYAGQWNCRKIGTSSTWSQHSWGNALDLTNVNYGYSTDPENQAYLDTVVDFLRVNEEKLSLRMILWRGKSLFTGNKVSGHQDHIHVDFWPKGYSTPPCAKGSLRFRYESGRVVVGDPGPANGMTNELDPLPPKEEHDMKTISLWAGYASHDLLHLKATVKACQIMLANAGFADARSIDLSCAADGFFGQGTDASVRSFQRSKSLVADGVVGDKTWTALEAS